MTLNQLKEYDRTLLESKPGLDFYNKLETDLKNPKARELAKSKMFLNLLCEIGHAALQLERFQDAKTHYLQALDLFKSNPDSKFQARHQKELSQIY